MPAGFRYPERALRVHSRGSPREASPCIYQIWLGKISSRSRAAFCYAREVDVLLFASNHTPTISSAWIWFGQRQEGTADVLPGPIPCFSNKTPLSSSSSYLRGWEPSPLNARSQLHALTDWLTELAGLTGALHAHDQPPWRHEQNALPLAARLTLTHPQSCKQPSMQSCEIIVVLGIELKLPKLSVDMVNSRGDVCVLNIPLRKLTMVLL